MADNQAKFKEMLNNDVVVYANIIKLTRFLIAEQVRFQKFNKLNQDASHPDSPFKSKEEASIRYAAYKRIQPKLMAMRTRYNARQNDYKTNKAYKLGNSIKEWGGGMARTLKGWWNSIAGAASSLKGLGEPLSLTVAAVVATGAVISVAIVAFFVNKYFTETYSDLVAGQEAIAEVNKTNPPLAAQMQADLNKSQTTKDEIAAEEAKSSGSFLDNISNGVKYGIAAIAVLVGGGVAYTQYEKGQKTKHEAEAV